MHYIIPIRDTMHYIIKEEAIDTEAANTKFITIMILTYYWYLCVI